VNDNFQGINLTGGRQLSRITLSSFSARGLAKLGFCHYVLYILWAKIMNCKFFNAQGLKNYATGVINDWSDRLLQ
jgi:hypothetical protein